MKLVKRNGNNIQVVKLKYIGTVEEVSFPLACVIEKLLFEQKSCKQYSFKITLFHVHLQPCGRII